METTDDGFFDGALRLRQPRRGHRIGTDAVLLAAACPKNVSKLVDLGSGVGAVGLRMAQITPEARVWLVDRDADMLALARFNADLNGLGQRVETVEADIFARNDGTADKIALVDVVLTNPPFDAAGTVRVSPDQHRAAAHVMTGELADWVKAGIKWLRPRGELIMIHRADALPQVLDAFGNRLGGIVLRPVYPAHGEPAHRILVKGTKGSKAPLRLLAPLVLHGTDGAFTPETDAIHRGTASVDWQ